MRQRSEVEAAAQTSVVNFPKGAPHDIDAKLRILDDALAILRDDMAPLISRAEGLQSNLVNAVRDRKNRGCLRYSLIRQTKNA
jgi:hypothetical protein